MKPSKRAQIIKDFVDVLEKENAIESDEKYAILMGIVASIALKSDEFSVHFLTRENLCVINNALCR